MQANRETAASGARTKQKTNIETFDRRAAGSAARRPPLRINKRRATPQTHAHTIAQQSDPFFLLSLPTRGLSTDSKSPRRRRLLPPPTARPLLVLSAKRRTRSRSFVAVVCASIDRAFENKTERDLPNHAKKNRCSRPISIRRIITCAWRAAAVAAAAARGRMAPLAAAAAAAPLRRRRRRRPRAGGPPVDAPPMAFPRRSLLAVPTLMLPLLLLLLAGPAEGQGGGYQSYVDSVAAAGGATASEHLLRCEFQFD